MNILYHLGKTIGLPAYGIVAGLATIHLIEHCRGNPQGPIYTASTQRGPGLVFLVLSILGFTGVYALFVDVISLLR